MNTNESSNTASSISQKADLATQCNPDLANTLPCPTTPPSTPASNKAAMKVKQALACLLAAASLPSVLRADDPARFDLIGPKIQVRVTRGFTTLPIAQVPNLQPGDKIWLKADLPPSQSNHLLLIVAFLRGTTNEPPDNWFTEIDTWDKKDREGTVVTVPADAQQALLFIAPETGGDFKTLRSAVKGKPGLFIRADADLNQASFEQQRIERYLAAMKTVTGTDQKAIEDHSAKLAATLALKPDDKCFKQPVEQQVNCLTQSSAPVLLADGHGQSIAEALSTGASSDFITAAAVTPAAGAGVYSAYVGAVVDLVHLVTLLRTAQYQYIPGLSFPEDATLNLKLNAPPSFVNPKTVIVIGLPAIQKAVLPPLHSHDPNAVACLLQPRMTLQLEGAPLVFSTSFAHDIVLRLNQTAGSTSDLPLKPDAFEGGLIVTKPEAHRPVEGATPPKSDAKPPTGSELTVTGTVRGKWGFDSFDGPTLTLQQVAGKNWKVVGDTQLLAGKDNHLTLQGDGTACVQHIALTSEKEKPVDVSFKPDAGKDGKGAKNTLALDVSLKTIQPGGYTLAVQQFGDPAPQKVPLTAYTADIHLDAVKIHAGDNAAILTGQGLKDVVSIQLGDQAFTPTATGNDDKTVHLEAKSPVSPADGSNASVKLKDGRTMDVKVSAAAARPALKLLSFKATSAPSQGAIPVTLGAKDDIPLEGQLTFVVQTKDVFPRTQTVEVATADGSVHTSLSLAANNLVLQDGHTAVANLDPSKAFGQSAFGKLQMRPVAADGTPGDWTPLGTLVRAPQITAIECTTSEAPTCKANGKNLFLAQSFSAAQDFSKPTEVPTGFAEGSLPVPTPTDGATLYLKLRDDPAAIATIKLPTPIQKPAPAPSQSAAPAPPATPSEAPSTATPTPAAAAKPASPPSPAPVPKPATPAPTPNI